MEHETGTRGKYEFRLYIADAKPQSARALNNVRRICEKYFKDNYKLEVIDIREQPDAVSEAQILAIPTLVRISPLPLRKIIGDLSDESRVLQGLGVPAAQATEP